MDHPILKIADDKPLQLIERGAQATMWHEGTKSFYRVIVVEPRTPQQVMDELGHACQEHEG